MNFKFMPELDWIAGYPLALVAIVLSAVDEPHRAEVDRLLDQAGIDRGVDSVMVGSESTD